MKKHCVHSPQLNVAVLPFIRNKYETETKRKRNGALPNENGGVDDLPGTFTSFPALSTE